MLLRRSRARRAWLAAAACLLWLTGVEALPALHEALHAQLAPHRHDGGAIVLTSFEETTHRHADGTMHFAAAKRGSAGPARGASRRASDPSHRADGLAHHAAALAPAALPLTQPLPVDRRPILVAVAAVAAPIPHEPPAAAARGPPAIA
jgi:hypothetical protein